MPDENSREYRVVFAQLPNRGQEPGLIVISPSPDKWNDFGFRVRVDIAIYPLGGHRTYDPLLLQGFLGFLGQEAHQPDARLVDEVLSNAIGEHVDPTKLPDFFTMLPDMSGYRKIIAELGSGEDRKSVV